MMRDGVLIIEESPEGLMTRCGTTSLEDAFLILSQKQETASYSRTQVYQMLINLHALCIQIKI